MLQRIQTVFLILIAVCMVLVLFFPLWESIEPGPEGDILVTAWGLQISAGDQITEVQFPYMFVAILAIASVVVTIIEITKFKNRLLQIKLGALNSLFMAGTLIASVLMINALMEEAGTSGEYGIALWFPAIAMILNIFANRFIRRDEKLVRSADRIR